MLAQHPPHGRHEPKTTRRLRRSSEGWSGQSGGATAILRAACFATTSAGERAAWIDGEHMLTSNSWIDGSALLKPTTRRNALRAAEEILRSGGFALVVLSGTEPVGTEAVRLTRA